MSNNEEKIYSNSEMEAIKMMTSIETRQNFLNESFESHKKEDSEHFDRLYKGEAEILAEINKIPEKIRSDVMDEAEEKFVNITEFKVFKTWIIASVTIGTMAGTIIGSIINYIGVLKKIIN